MRALFACLATRRACRIAERVTPHLPDSGRALDIGSGTGHNAEALRRATRLELVETDVADFHVVGPGPVRCGDADLPFDDDAFDAATLFHVLQFTADPAALLTEAGRVARRVVVLQSTCDGAAGRAFLAARGFVLGRAAFHAARAVRFTPPSPFPMRVRGLLSRAGVRSAAAAAGFSVVGFETGARSWLAAGSVSRDLFVLERAR